MKKLIGKIAIVISLASFGHSTWAQVYACQYIKSAGLNFDNNQWGTSAFQLESPFFLRIVDGRISQDAAAKILDTTAASVGCTSRYSSVHKSIVYTCSDYSSQLIFSSDTLLGAVSHIFGGVSTTRDRDSLVVSAFNCQKI